VSIRIGDKIAGGVLASASALVVLVMAHHPTNLKDVGLVNLVHGVMMALALLSLAGFARFAQRLGFDRFSVLCGFVAYGAGAFGNLLAATVNGFAAPALAADGASREILAIAWELSQALAYEAVFALSIAYVFWGADLFMRGVRAMGLAGLAAGLVPAALLGGGALSMHVSGAFAIYSAQAAFGVVAGIYLMRGRD